MLMPEPMPPKPLPGADREIRQPRPNGWIQWKGTDVCMDVYCLCGALGHVEGSFAYYVRCGDCGRTFAVNGDVQLIELTPDETAEAESHGCILNTDDY